MSYYSEIIKITDDVEKKMQDEILLVKLKYMHEKSLAIQNFVETKLGFHIGDILKYKCSGSGYIGKLERFSGNEIILNICNKSGEVKNKYFECNYLDLGRLSKL